MTNNLQDMVLRLLKNHVSKKFNVSLDHFILADLRLYGDEYQEFVDSFFETWGEKVSPVFYDSVISMVPSEWHGVLGGVFAKRTTKDATVRELVNKLSSYFLTVNSTSSSD